MSALLTAAGVTPSTRASADMLGYAPSSISRCRRRARSPTDRPLGRGAGFAFNSCSLTGVLGFGRSTADAAISTSYCGHARSRELNGLLLPCIGDLLPPPSAARAHRLQSLQQFELGNPDAAEASWAAVPAIDGELTLPEAWLPADHPLRSVPAPSDKT